MKKTITMILSAMLITGILSACGEDEYAETDGELADAIPSATSITTETDISSQTEKISISETSSSSVSKEISDTSKISETSETSQTTTASSTSAKKNNSVSNDNNNNVQYEQPSYDDNPQNEPDPSENIPVTTTAPPQTDPPAAIPSGSFVSDDMFVVCDNGYMFTVGGNMEDVIISIGEADIYEESPSCLGDGTDMVYTYDSFTIYTFVNTSGENIITSVDLNGSATSKGISVGMTIDDIISAYGTEYESVGQYISYYAGSDYYIEFTLDGSIITNISYYYDYVPQ